MKQQGSNTKRSRYRGGGKRNSGGGGGRNSFESNGPDVKIRGSAQQVQEKYLTLAHDASSSGDWVSAEAYYQYAEHYHRISNADGGKAPAQGPAPGPAHLVTHRSARVSACHHPGVDDFEPAQPQPTGPALQVARHDLDLGQLGHLGI